MNTPRTHHLTRPHPSANRLTDAAQLAHNRRQLRALADHANAVSRALYAAHLDRLLAVNTALHGRLEARGEGKSADRAAGK